MRIIDRGSVQLFRLSSDEHCRDLQDDLGLPPGYWNEGDIESYRKMFRDVPVGGTVCEIGVLLGRSLCSVADIIKERNLIIAAVDTFQYQWRPMPQQRQRCEQNLEQFGIRDHIIIYEMTSDEAALKLEKARFDLVFIDGDHFYSQVKRDISNYRKLVKPNGWLTGHDYALSVDNYGVRRAVHEAFDGNFRIVPTDIWKVQL